MILRLCQTFRKLRRHQDGVTAIEFALIAPVFFGFILATIDISGYFFSVSQLNSALQVAARQVRTGQIQGNDSTTRDNFRTALCQEITPVFIRNCLTDVRVVSDPYNSFSSSAYTNPDANGDGIITDAETTFNTGQPGCPVLLTVYYRYATLVPGLQNLLAATIPNSSYISNTVAVRNEPFPTGSNVLGSVACPDT